jgi:hypothetical protein
MSDLLDNLVKRKEKKGDEQKIKQRVLHILSV